MSDSDIVFRIRQIMSDLGMNQTIFAKKIEIKQQNLSQILSGKRPVGDAVINKFVLNLGVSKIWLLSGVGAMYLDSEAQEVDKQIRQIETKEKGEVLLKNIRYLIQNSGLNDGKFADKIEIDRSNFSKIIKGKYPCGDAVVNKIVLNLGVSKTWLLSGVGAMYLDSEAQEVNKQIREVEAKEKGEVCLLPVAAWGGTLQGYSSGVLERDCKKFKIPIPGADFLIPISGDSMEPDFRPGDIVAIKRVDPALFIQWGKVYVIDTPNGCVIKELQPTSEKGIVSCVSRKEKYKPFEINLDSAFGIYSVCGVFRIE